LTPADIASNDLYGYSLELDSGTLLAGAPGRAASGGAWNQGNTPGKAWVWTGSGSTWTETAYLTPSDGESMDSFGNAVAIEGDTIAVGAQQTQRIAFLADTEGAWLIDAMATAWMAPRLARWFKIEA